MFQGISMGAPRYFESLQTPCRNLKFAWGQTDVPGAGTPVSPRVLDAGVLQAPACPLSPP